MNTYTVSISSVLYELLHSQDDVHSVSVKQKCNLELLVNFGAWCSLCFAVWL